MAPRILMLFSLAQVALAATIDKGVGTCESYLANFDDLPTPPAGALPLTSKNVGNYKGLSYNMRVANQTNKIDLSFLSPFLTLLNIPAQNLIIDLGPIAPKSPDNAIGNGLVNGNLIGGIGGLLDGGLLNGGKLPALTSQSTITIGEPNIEAFDLNSVWAALILTGASSAATVPTGGSLSVYGDCWDGTKFAQTPTEPLVYSPNSVQRADMLKYEFKYLKRCRSVTFGLATDATDVVKSAATVFVLDDVEACLWRKEGS